MQSESNTYRSPQIKVRLINKTLNNAPIDISESVLDFTEDTDLEQPANTFQMVLNPVKHKEFAQYGAGNIYSIIKQIVKKGDIISVGIDTPDSFLYRIESVMESEKTEWMDFHVQS